MRGDDTRGIKPLVAPIAPTAPRSWHAGHLRCHHVLVGDLLLDDEVLVTRVSGLITDVGEILFRAGVDVINVAPADFAMEFVRGEFRQRGLALGRVGGQDPEAGGGQKLLGAVAFGALDGCATDEKGCAQ